ncbi:MAG: spiro-SPASM protein [Treponema sp.]|nr:spiro-SPASM protein [Candidatus Treponema equi]
MKNLVFLYAGKNSTHAFDKVFSENSAFGRCLMWAGAIPGCLGIVIMSSTENQDAVKEQLGEVAVSNARIIVKDSWLCSDIVETMAVECAAAKADNAVYTTADRPFMDSWLTNEVLECHEKYIAEYTFADGYPYGFAPEVIHGGTLNILNTFAKETHRELAQVPVSNECIFNLLKADINSFEIEAVIAPKDYRMLRFDFSCGIKRNLLACQRLYGLAMEKDIAFNAKKLADLAEQSAEVQQTLPAFYNVQICQNMSSLPLYSPYPEAYKSKFGKLPVVSENSEAQSMSLEKFNGLVSQISDFSEDAVVGLSGFAEPLLEKNICAYIDSVLQNKNLSVLIETDGTLVTPELAENIAAVVAKHGPRNTGEKSIIWIVSLDAATEAMHSTIVKGGTFTASLASITILEKSFPGCVYPQLTRMNENESELEQFYRFWHDKNSPSKGRLIIQKYDDCCKTLPARKPADLSPLERNVCWHLKRDMTILWDGSVPLCRQFLLSSSIGNAFEEGIEKIWGNTLETVKDHLAANFSEKCRDCDEYYTFNF